MSQNKEARQRFSAGNNLKHKVKKQLVLVFLDWTISKPIQFQTTIFVGNRLLFSGEFDQMHLTLHISQIVKLFILCVCVDSSVQLLTSGYNNPPFQARKWRRISLVSSNQSRCIFNVFGFGNVI